MNHPSPRLLHGMHTPQQERERGRPLELTALIWNQCNIHCPYCGMGGFYRSLVPTNTAYIIPLTHAMATHGFKTLIIQGPGEPFLHKEKLFAILEQATREGITTIVYSNGLLINAHDVERILALDVSLCIKLDSLDKERAIRIYNTKGTRYPFATFPDSGDIPLGLALGISRGLGERRRLGLVCVLDDHTIADDADEAKRILTFAREQGIIPFFNSMLIPDEHNRTLSSKFSHETISRVFGILTRHDNDEHGINNQPGLLVWGSALDEHGRDYITNGEHVHSWRYEQGRLSVEPVATQATFFLDIAARHQTGRRS